MRRILFLVLSISSCVGTKKILNTEDCISFSRDSVTYCQSNSPWLANCYTFYYATSSTESGYFAKKIESDDGQFWLGKGRFYKSNDTIFLNSYNLIRSLDGKEQDSSVIAPAFLIKKKNILIQSNQNGLKVTFSCQPPLAQASRLCLQQLLLHFRTSDQ
jgi:hypothetical protein